MAKHSKLSPSGAKRWMACPGSVNLVDSLGIKDKASIYALEGTAAHFLGEQCLLNTWQPDECMGKTIHVEEWDNHDEDTDNFFHTGFKSALKKDTKGLECIYHEKFTVNVDMVDAVQVYVDHIWGHVAKEAPTPLELRVEVKYPLTHLGVEGLDGGTTDTLLISRMQRFIIVSDYKHGQGVAVEVVHNPQTRQYALGVLHELESKEGIDISDYDVYLEIIQPRAHHPDGRIRVEYLSAKELLKWQDEDLIPAAVATKHPEAPLYPGDDQCRFCNAPGQCPAQYSKAQEIAVSDFDSLPGVDTLTPEQKYRIMDHAGMLRSFIVAVENQVKIEIDQGSEDYPELKLVRKKTNREFLPIATDEIVSPLLDHLSDDEMYTKKMCTMTEIERLLKKKLGVEDAKEVMSEITEKPEGATVVAKQSDPRIAIEPSVVTDFNDL